MTKPKPCNCGAYDHPHRLKGGKCRELYTNVTKEDTTELARDFMREEARAYNQERSIFEQVRNLT